MKYSLLLSFPLLLLSGCATSPPSYPQHPLVDQILRPRPGYTGLTNSFCTRFEDDECKELVVQDHPLTPEFRKQLNDFKFICNVAGRRFKICIEKEGLCRYEIEKRDCFLCRDRVKQVFIPITDYQYLLNANAKCFNRERYPFWEF